MPKVQMLLTTLCLSGGLLAAGCASQPTTAESYKPSGFLSDYSQLQPAPDGSGAQVYFKPGFNLKDYNRVLLDPIKVWYRNDAEYKGIDPNELKTLTDYFHQALVKALEPAYPLVNKPGPGVLRIRTAVTELTPTNTGMSVVTLVVPYAAVADVASGGGTGSAPYLGDAAIEAEFRDSRSNELLAAYVDKRVGKKYDVDMKEGVGSAVSKGVDSYSRAYSTWGYAQQAFDYWAQKLRRRLDEAHGVKTPAS
ncbi:MAG: DUF3313 domain-containing protein [Candidatus Competibacteraceae bacterium]